MLCMDLHKKNIINLDLKQIIPSLGRGEKKILKICGTVKWECGE